MDFLKKKMKEMLDDDKDKAKHEQHGAGGHSHGHDDHGQAQSYYNNQPGYGGPPQQHGYGGGPPPGGPHLPPGWVQQWDQNSQRYYYLEHATGRSQWDAPTFSHGPPPGPPPPGGYGQGHSGHDYSRGMFGHDSHGGHGHGKDKDKNSAVKYGLGGAAVGALAGGVIAHEMTEASDGEGHHVTQSTTYTAAPPPASDPYASMPPPAPTEDVDGESISSSDQEEIEERREELEEAQEEYNEAVEEGYES